MDPFVDISSCTIPSIDPLSPHLRIPVIVRGSNRSKHISAIIDSGATSNFISYHFVNKYSVTKKPLNNKILVRNVDGTENKAGKLTHYCTLSLTIGNHTHDIDLLITNLGTKHLILGLL